MTARVVLGLAYFLALTSCQRREEDDFGLRSAGAATVFDTTRDAFSLPLPELSSERRRAFFVGNAFFNENWVTAPASAESHDGLGPLFNARSCSGCRLQGRPQRSPPAGQPMSTMLLRVSLPVPDVHGAPLPDPVYGDQIQGARDPSDRTRGRRLRGLRDRVGCFRGRRAPTSSGDRATGSRTSRTGRSTPMRGVPAALLRPCSAWACSKPSPKAIIEALADPDDHDQ